MPEQVFKLQPNRTLALRGFDGLGASAAIHSATANSFRVSGIFRDPADFAVLVLYDADNFYEHPRLKHLPDMDFSGLTLTFDVRYSGLMPLDSLLFPTIDWPFLDGVGANGESYRVRIFDPSRAVKVGGTHTAASGSLNITAEGVKEFDRITIWYLNLNFDYIVPKVECAFLLTAAGAGTTHSIVAGGVTHSYTEVSGDNDVKVAQGLHAALATSALVSVSRGVDTLETGPPNQLNLRASKDDGASFVVSKSATSYTLYGVGVNTIVSALAAAINGTNWTVTGTLLALEATASGATLALRSTRLGADGNLISLYVTSKNSRLTSDKATVPLAGGSSDTTWRITLDFSAVGIATARLLWLTFAPPLGPGNFSDVEWQAQFDNWTVTGPAAKKYLKVAAPGSIRVEEDDSWCKFTGSWASESGFFSGGYASRSSQIGDTVTVKYSCASTHDLYLGTSLYTTSGTVGIRLNGDSETSLNCFLQNEPAVNTRRRIRSGVPAGEHSVVIRVTDAGTPAGPKSFYFDYLEAAVVGDVPDPLPARSNICPALDYSTDHTFKLSPARLLWNLKNLGFQGPLNEYIGVFWWNQRKRMDASFPTAKIAFTGSFEPQETIFITIDDRDIGKTTWWNEDNAVLAKHFALSINATMVGVSAAASGNELTITSRSPKQAYAFSLAVRKQGSSSGAVTITQRPSEYANSNLGIWQVDPEQDPPLNRGAREWHSDLFSLCQADGREVTLSESMELVLPPAGFGAVYAGGTAVQTDVGFGKLSSTHCSFSSAMRDYQKRVFKNVADLMASAGLTPNLQFGEFLWWFFTNKTASNTNGGMAYYDPETVAAATAALGRPLYKFTDPDNDPMVNGGADATFLRNRLRDHVNGIISYVRSYHPNAQFELLFPYDVNHPQPAGIHNLGGRLNRFINLPSEWESKSTANFDRIKMEALDFGAWCRNLDLAKTAIDFPIQLGWPRDSIRHLVPIFRTGYPYDKEVAMADAAGIPVVNLWAFDHVCIYNLPPVPLSTGRSVRF